MCITSPRERLIDFPNREGSETLAGTNISKLNLKSNRQISTIDVRNTKLKLLDLRDHDVFSLDARGAKIKILVVDPELARLSFQTTIDAGVKFASK